MSDKDKFEDWTREELVAQLGAIKDWLERGATIQRTSTEVPVIVKIKDGNLSGGMHVNFGTFGTED